MNQIAAELEDQTVRHRRTNRRGTIVVDTETNGGIAVESNDGRVTYTTMSAFEADWRMESEIDHGPEIHGRNAVWVAAVLERLIYLEHPEHEIAIEEAQDFINAERRRKRAMAPSPVPHYDPAEWDSYTQFLVHHNID